MFCTDVLRALGREQLEGFSLAGRGVGGKGCSGIRILHWAGEVVLWWKRVHRGVEWWSLSTSAYLLLPFTFSKVPSTVHQHPPPPPPRLPSLRCRRVCFVDFPPAPPRHSRLRRQTLWAMQRGREVFGRAPPPPPTHTPEGGDGRINETRSEAAGTDVGGAISCRGSAGSQCPLCRWGTSCWWPTTGQRTPGERGACRVIS